MSLPGKAEAGWAVGRSLWPLAQEAQAWRHGARVRAPGTGKCPLLWPVGRGGRDTQVSEPVAFLLSFRNSLCWGQMCGAQTLELVAGGQ